MPDSHRDERDTCCKNVSGVLRPDVFCRQLEFRLVLWALKQKQRFHARLGNSCCYFVVTAQTTWFRRNNPFVSKVDGLTAPDDW